MGAIVEGIIGGVATVSAVIGIATFVWRRNRPTNSIRADPGMTPFDPDFYEGHGAQNTGITTAQRPFATEGPGAEAVTFRRLFSSSPIVLPISRPMRPPVGLSDKEVARLRRNLCALAEIPTPQQPCDNPQDSTWSVSRHTSSLNVTEISGLRAGLPYETRRQLIHFSEIESLPERLRVGGIVFEAPPSYYTEGNE